jgi:hypothetical protein
MVRFAVRILKNKDLIPGFPQAFCNNDSTLGTKLLNYLRTSPLLGVEIINLQGTDNTLAKTRDISRNGKAMSFLHG